MKTENFMQTEKRQPQRPLILLFHLTDMFKNGNSQDI